MIRVGLSTAAATVRTDTPAHVADPTKIRPADPAARKIGHPMGQITRHDQGTATIPVALLHDLEWVFDMDLAAPRGVVKPLADKLREYHRDVRRDPDVDNTDG